MGGMAAARHGARAVRRASPTNRSLAYAMVEAIIGLASLVFHPLFAALTDWS